MNSRQNVSKYFLLGLILVAVLLAGCAQNAASNNDTSANTTSTEVGAVSRVTVTDQIQTSGSLSAARLSQLAWKVGGVVDSVNVQVGDKVKAGDVLAVLRADSVPANLITAQSDLDTARQNLDALYHPSAQTLAVAWKAQADAYKTFNTNTSDLYSAVFKKEANGDADLFNKVSSAWSELTSARNAMPLATASTDAQLYYWAERAARLERTNLDYAALKADLASKLDATEVGKLDALVTAQLAFEEAAANFAATVTDSASAIVLNSAFSTYHTGAEALSTATEKLYYMEVKPSATDVVAAQAKVDAAQTNLNSMYLIAPFDGEIIAVNGAPGDLVNSGTSGLIIVDRNTLQVAAQVDETDIAQVAVGNQATISMDALPGVMLTGKVVSINPIGATISGLVKYTVNIAIDPTEHNVLFGATADVTLLTSEPRDMLAVPIGAVQNDDKGEYVWRVNPAGSTERVEVVSDSIQDEVVAITGDLKEGDQVMVILTTTTNNNNNRFGPGGGDTGGAIFVP
jgi:RND family efflux transporter MFP subunit